MSLFHTYEHVNQAANILNITFFLALPPPSFFAFPGAAFPPLEPPLGSAFFAP